MSNVRKLIAWQRARQLVKECYALSRAFPQDERYGLTSQLRRAAVSVAANIAEGYGRWHRREFINFLSMSNGSACEVETYLFLAVDLEFVAADAVRAPLDLVDEVGKINTALRRSRASPGFPDHL